jgi:DNA-binding LacI/PurR family transcriptional regulator
MKKVADKSPVKRRPPVKQRMILADLRREIAGGVFQPGNQLPTRAELEQRFQVSSTTLQRALDRLGQDGFVEAQGARGTFVSNHPPHLCNYGLVIPHRPSNAPGKFRHFWTVLANEAVRVETSNPSIRFPIFYVNNATDDVEAYQQLLRHITAHRLAGLIFITPPDLLQGTPIMDFPGLARVSVRMAMASELPADMPISVVWLDRASFVDKALDSLAARGRKRVAVISSALWFGKNEAYLTSALVARFGSAPMCWRIGLDLDSPQYANNAVQLLMRGSPSERPDALVIADDNFVEYATAGLVASGVTSTEAIDVVAHCNFPWPTPSVVPAMRLGYDARHVLQACIDQIDSQRRGEAVPAETIIPAVFEGES